MIKPGLEFYDFVRWASNSFESPSSKEWTDSWFELIKWSTHNGDCTNSAYTCDLCSLESFLKEYMEYSFNYENFIKKYTNK